MGATELVVLWAVGYLPGVAAIGWYAERERVSAPYQFGALMGVCWPAWLVVAVIVGAIYLIGLTVETAVDRLRS